ncbi:MULTISPECIES: restriction endonuclease subunit S [unclassified Gemella]|uniref:restriction endonuclease subunit S n=1 Tax=unclassified Gemella TaxID=2624949 RepID=UPI0015CF9CF8|nr:MULTISPECIES: restriction endonuclease subunit S [unclassified Gemella]MBF0710177.1 restriction endonuclease subunit S [Gemella sp. GL1.1]NYS27521.1 restriction endonuclease subunit S [Gemella sp. GL1]
MIDITKWKKFQISSLFQIKRPAPRSVKKYNDGSIPFVSSGNYNNGVDSYRMPLDNELLEKGNCITVSPVDGSTFYQPTDFLGRGGAGSSILLLYNDKLTKYTGLFLAAIIRGTLTRKYQYNDMGSSESIKLEYIKLPVNIKNEIDWEYMERYVKQLYARERKFRPCYDLFRKNKIT